MKNVKRIEEIKSVFAGMSVEKLEQALAENASTIDDLLVFGEAADVVTGTEEAAVAYMNALNELWDVEEALTQLIREKQ